MALDLFGEEFDWKEVEEQLMRRQRFMGASKYNSTKIDCADGKFDSGLEYKRWVYLKAREQSGEIANLVRQVPYTLIPAQYKDGKCLYRELKYVSDMEYDIVATGEHVVEDVKGMVLPVFKLKQKLMFYFFGVEVKVIRKW